MNPGRVLVGAEARSCRSDLHSIRAGRLIFEPTDEATASLICEVVIRFETHLQVEDQRERRVVFKDVFVLGIEDRGEAPVAVDDFCAAVAIEHRGEVTVVAAVALGIGFWFELLLSGTVMRILQPRFLLVRRVDWNVVRTLVSLSTPSP